jgi:hypothetical protein
MMIFKDNQIYKGMLLTHWRLWFWDETSSETVKIYTLEDCLVGEKFSSIEGVLLFCSGMIPSCLYIIIIRLVAWLPILRVCVFFNVV